MLRKVNFKEVDVEGGIFDQREVCMAVLLSPNGGAMPKEMKETFIPLVDKIENGNREMLLEAEEHKVLMSQLDRKFPRVSQEICDMVDELDNAEEYDPNSN